MCAFCSVGAHRCRSASAIRSKNVTPIATRKAPIMMRTSSDRTNIMPMPKATRNTAENVRKVSQVLMRARVRATTTDSKSKKSNQSDRVSVWETRRLATQNA